VSGLQVLLLAEVLEEEDWELTQRQCLAMQRACLFFMHIMWSAPQGSELGAFVAASVTRAVQTVQAAMASRARGFFIQKKREVFSSLYG
jgi:hypothetical protein